MVDFGLAQDLNDEKLKKPKSLGGITPSTTRNKNSTVIETPQISTHKTVKRKLSVLVIMIFFQPSIYIIFLIQKSFYSMNYLCLFLLFLCSIN